MRVYQPHNCRVKTTQLNDNIENSDVWVIVDNLEFSVHWFWFCTGFCSAAESSSAVIYIQGSDSAITNGSDGMIITVKDVIPYFHITDGKESKLVPLESLTDITYPVQAVVNLLMLKIKPIQ